ncbi:uncharacterized protein MONOS_15854 [Monocercomonoides exilis]|uniref:uncharacterized protein n=1 Tax=Monocercomonoides exilis TaxID=2049356 RepID=UPI0035594A8B|nr:hypothetical protein MONOS_15854 [Monocercomonoides exilis]|eukprot:MONOS_15854.1-p1 / transcript=MONOS_15854.1 / gene=MONOS_15854 / organism=Monocercomonoides_exilis_PA203 / gene_product=unspecified product / transcript_product=unspecified product / location=Mono_scaffold01380:6523-6987(+) / protein_length=127 / sequence_SO=supercontig / SO=protein_coding / is_pseudo=false
MKNKTFVGRDVYVKCANEKIQIGTELFEIDFRAQFSETIFASSSTSNASDIRQCGAMSKPCISLNSTLPHIIPSVFSNLLIDKSAEVTWEASACDVSIKSLDAEGARRNVVLNSSIGSKTKSLCSC